MTSPNRPRPLLFALFGQWVNHACRAGLERARQLAAEMVSLDEVTGPRAPEAHRCEGGISQAYRQQTKQ
jgi:hypothetical protein